MPKNPPAAAKDLTDREATDRGQAHLTPLGSSSERPAGPHRAGRLSEDVYRAWVITIE